MGLEIIDPTVLLAAGLALAAFVLLRKTRGLFGASVNAKSASSPRKEPLAARNGDSALSDAPIEVLRWQVEMHQTARDLKAEIDTKLVALQAVTRLAQEERQRLEMAIDHARQMGLGVPDVLTTIESLAENPAAAGRLPPLAPPAELPLNNDVAARVQQLSAAGHSAASIAEQFAVPLGDVEMTLQITSYPPLPTSP